MDFLTQKKLQEFLNFHNFILDADMFVACDAFRKEMRDGLKGNPKSLKMLPSYLSAEEKTLRKGKCLVIDAGGTHLRVALYRYDGELTCENRAEADIPTKEVTAEEFFGLFADKVREVLNGETSVESVGFCFSYPTSMQSDLDGEVVTLAKELKVKNLVGKKVGESLKKALADKGITVGKIVVLNDTTAALLGGAASGTECDGRIGYIMGTGVNVCYEERSEKVLTCKTDEKTCIINIESGNFNRFPLSDFDKEVIASTENPDAQRFEKMTAGRYLGEIFSVAMRFAVKEGAISKTEIPTFSTERLSRFLESGETDLPLTGSDKDFALGLGLAVAERSAIMCATVLSAVMLEAGYGENLPALVAVEGSTFGKFKAFREKFISYATDYAESCARSVVFYEKSRLCETGSAFAALSVKK